LKEILLNYSKPLSAESEFLGNREDIFQTKCRFVDQERNPQPSKGWFLVSDV